MKDIEWNIYSLIVGCQDRNEIFLPIRYKAFHFRRSQRAPCIYYWELENSPKVQVSPLKLPDAIKPNLIYFPTNTFSGVWLIENNNDPPPPTSHFSRFQHTT